MDADYEGFSIREYTRNIRSVELQKCWPFTGEITIDRIQSILPPITVSKFRWWSHELASLLAKSPVAVENDSEPDFHRKSKPCKKRSVAEIAPPQIQSSQREDEGEKSDGSKIKRRIDFVVTKKSKSKKFKDSDDRKIANKVNNIHKEEEEADGVNCSFGIKENSGGVMSLSKDQDSEFKIPAVLMAKRKVCWDKSKIDAPPQCHCHVKFSDPNGNLCQFKNSVASSELCCLEMSRLSLSSSEYQSSVNYNKKAKVVSNDQTRADDMKLEESRQQSKFPPAVSERHAREVSRSSCFRGPYLSLQERRKDALDLERKGHGVPPTESFISSASSQPASADTHCGTLMQKSVCYRQRHVEQLKLGFPLSLQGELVDEVNGESCRSFDLSGLGTGSFRSASSDNSLLLRNLVDFSSEMKHSTELPLARDGVGKFPEKTHKYFPARLGLDETFTEKSFFFSDTSNGECSQTVNYSDNTQATMRLMGKDVSVGTSYSDMVRTEERIIAQNAFIGSHNQQSWLWQRTTFGLSQNHSTTALDQNWNTTLLQDASKDPFPRFCEPHHSLASQFPPTILSPLADLTFSQQQQPFPSNYNNVNIGLLPNARELSLEMPFSCTDSTESFRRSQPHIESSRSGISFIDPTEQLVSFYGSSSINVGKANKRVASLEEYPMKNHKIPKLPMQELFAGQKSQT